MFKKMLIRVAILVVISGLVLTVSCAKKTIDSSAQSAAVSEAEAARIAAEEARLLELAKEKALIEEAELAAAAILAEKIAAQRDRFINENVYFSFDSSALNGDAQYVLKEKAQWLLSNPSVQIRIGGYCDNKGTTEYNLALGDRRANAVKGFLSDMGIPITRMETVSYGEEYSPASHTTEAQLSKDRRASVSIK
ncbi:MAG: hypothetical protein B6I31_01970 [Desulfobacteraceae bacterium 4572_19]|nr:MAG: hypothetical protein B6I31_01970 [Desulfobacteraceae bacterium 4572_19]